MPDDLPDDLVELAGQLECDAKFLADRYPARSLDFGFAASASDARAGAAAPRYFSYRAPLAAAVLLAAVGAGLWATNFVSWKAKNADRGEGPIAAGAAEVTPVVSFERFSGAEQEAVLDLLEEEGARQGSLSI